MAHVEADSLDPVGNATFVCDTRDRRPIGPPEPRAATVASKRELGRQGLALVVRDRNSQRLNSPAHVGQFPQLYGEIQGSLREARVAPKRGKRQLPASQSDASMRERENGKGRVRQGA